jgi:hypothetical protein
MSRLNELKAILAELNDALEQIDGELSSHAVRQIDARVYDIDNILARDAREQVHCDGQA